MDRITRRPNHIEDALIKIHKGQWFGWTDSKNKIYANLKLTEKFSIDGELADNPHSLPNEEEVNDKLTELQTNFDALEWKRNRMSEYPTIEECVHAILDDDLENLQILRQVVKDKFPKENA